MTNLSFLSKDGADYPYGFTADLQPNASSDLNELKTKVVEPVKIYRLISIKLKVVHNFGFFFTFFMLQEHQPLHFGLWNASGDRCERV